MIPVRFTDWRRRDGQVFRARDTKLKRPVAIKILPPSLAADQDRLARFQREAEVLASLNHPHIAGIYGLEESAGATALVMELVEGEDLSRRIARGSDTRRRDRVVVASAISNDREVSHISADCRVNAAKTGRDVSAVARSTSRPCEFCCSPSPAGWTAGSARCSGS